jgi:hypothetical protein
MCIMKFLNANTWVQTHDLRLMACITSVLCNRLLFRVNYKEKISIDFVEPARMHIESSRMRVESTRSMVRLQCRAVC